VTTPGQEFVWAQVPKNTTDRLTSFPVQPAKNGNAMRVDVRHGDVAWNPYANGGNGAPIPSGWRAEVVGPTEYQGDRPLRYQWSTMFDPAYVTDPRIDDPDDPNNGKPIWQVIFQWHQGGSDRGSSPPVGFIIVGNNILLDLHRHDPANELRSLPVGEWPVATLDRGTWHDFSAEIRWHQTDGSIKVWHNGVPVTFSPQVPPDLPGQPPYPPETTDTLTGLETLFPPQTSSTKPSSAYMKAGLYRKGVNTTPAGPFILYHDEFYRYEQGLVVMPIPIPAALRKLMPKIKLPKLPRPLPWPPPWPPFSRRGGAGGRRRL
jgi:hypothetical protein